MAQLNLSEDGHIATLIELALKEDLPKGDITSELFSEYDCLGEGQIIAKEACIVSGLPLIQLINVKGGFGLEVVECKADGDKVGKGELIAKLIGKISSLLASERIILNFLQHLSGVSTATSAAVAAAKGVKVYDTRKTLPAYRELEKYAVVVGGGFNHRQSLSDMVLVKNNHVDLLPFENRLERMRKVAEILRGAEILAEVEIEVRDLGELEEALKAQPQRIMLDNFEDKEIQKAVRMIREKLTGTLIEVSGGVTLERLRKLSEFEIDLVSIGAITHSARAVDMSMSISRKYS
jgi:nicotinate-nucleotide pyrophosphorylase (carboxylating)